MNLSRQVQTYLLDLQETVASLPADQIEQAIAVLLECAYSGHKVFICGNGGSASTATHFACDLAKNTVVVGAPAFKVIALNDNMALMTAWANDTDYDNVFAAQLEPLIESGDVVIGISCSGNSGNVLNALSVARNYGAYTIGFTGHQGGQLKEIVDLCIQAPSPHIEQQEDIHLILEHCICSAIRGELIRQYNPGTYKFTAVLAPESVLAG